ncbi:uncharacterized protein LOC143452864 [Clavelina lepadiformis]|uniref:uncharacterized protein LOC143452864 n=1 Tax=Clavelina lepadiformis TaxID=159417 RepID=UPI004041F454
MSLLLRQLTAHRSLHTSACSCITNRYPVKTPSMKETAIKLGFDKVKDMYPEYPLDEPPKFWFIKQLHTLKYRPYWEKEAMKELGLHRRHDTCVHINSPQMNEILWTVKHLIKIQPIRFPQGMPENSDVGYTQLKDNGELVIYKKIEAKEASDEDVVPVAPEEDWKVVSGYRMCNGCTNRRCLKYGMCQKLWRQRGMNYLEFIGPRLFNYVDNPEKNSKKIEALEEKDKAN